MSRAHVTLADVALTQRLHVARYSGATLSRATRFAALGLVERNHREVLNLSAGEAFSKAEEMLSELCHEDTEFVLLFADTELVGFCASRCVVEESLRVRYVLELQIEPDRRRKGLGRALICDARASGEQEDACGLMLTCDARNSTALDFYAGLGFVLSPCSPSACLPGNQRRQGEEANYELLVLLWDEGAMETLAARGAEARASLQAIRGIARCGGHASHSSDATTVGVKRAASPVTETQYKVLREAPAERGRGTADEAPPPTDEGGTPLVQELD